MLIVSIGLDEQGHKHLLGLRQGGSENATACTSLLTNVACRGHEYEYDAALKQLHDTATWLNRLNSDAANSPREGLEDRRQLQSEI